MTRPLDRHLDDDELDALVTSQALDVSASGSLSQEALGEAARHVESCQDCDRKVQMHRSAQNAIFLGAMKGQAARGQNCSDESEWVRVAAGLLEETEAKERMNHAAQCGHCGPLLRAAVTSLSNETTPDEEAALAKLGSARPDWQKQMAGILRGGSSESRRISQSADSFWETLFYWRRFALAAGAIALLGVVSWICIQMLRSPSAEQLLAQAYTEHRTLEVRIGEAKYAPLRVQRTAGGSNLDKPASLLKAEVLISENLGKKPNDPTWLQARARADLLDGNYDSAIKSLQRALEEQPDSSQLLTDLGSAYFLRARSTDRAIDYGNAVESFGKALAKTPDDPVALFNRALASEQIFLYKQAVDDWEHYLRIDPSSEWSVEVRSRLAAVQQHLKQHEQSQHEPLLTPSEIARRVADTLTLDKINDRIEDYLNVVVAEWLPEAYSDSPGQSTQDVRVALNIVSELLSRHGDRWLEDVLSHASSPSFPSAADHLALALRANDSGDNKSARENARAAEQLFAASGNDAGVLRSRVEYVFAAHDAQEGEPCILAARGQNSRLANRPYLWLRTQFHLELGTCYWLLGNLGDARRFYEEAASEAKASGYSELSLRSQSFLSGVNTAAGVLPESWTRTKLALQLFWSGPYPAMRGYNLYYNLFELARTEQQHHLEISVWLDALILSGSFSDNVLRAMAHSLMASAAIAAAQLGTAENEFTQASRFFALAPQIKSTRIARVEAEARLAEVETGEGRLQYAVSLLRGLEPEVSELSDNYLGALFYNTLGNAEFKLGKHKEAEAALRAAVTSSELQLQSLHDDRTRVEWSQRSSRTYRDLVQLRLRQGDAVGALEIWEWYRGAAVRVRETAAAAPLINNGSQPIVPHEVEAQLPNLRKETIISYVLLPQGLAIWVYDNRGVFTHWTEADSDDIARRASRFRSLCADPRSDLSDLAENAHRLYDLLASPIEHYLSPDRTLVVELDEALSGLPVDALIDRQNHYFAERGPIVSSLGIYYERGLRSSAPVTVGDPVLVAAVPAPLTDSIYPHPTPLPDAISEAEMVAQEFKTAHLFAGNAASVHAIVSELPSATIFHFAGHAISDPQRSGLLLSDAWLNASSLKTTALARIQLAVFSACDSQDGGGGGASSADSLVRVFLRAGVSHVMASRWNVDSIATKQFMEAFYHALLAGSSVPESMSQAQSRLRARPGMAHPYYWSAFTVFGEV